MNDKELRDNWCKQNNRPSVFYLDGSGEYCNHYVHYLEQELIILKSGTMTKDEIHNICHNLPTTVSCEEFSNGCIKQQISLYGQAPLADLITQAAIIFQKTIELYPQDTILSSMILNWSMACLKK